VYSQGGRGEETGGGEERRLLIVMVRAPSYIILGFYKHTLYLGKKYHYNTTRKLQPLAEDELHSAHDLELLTIIKSLATKVLARSKAIILRVSSTPPHSLSPAS
jgi:hypothetical protein